MNTVPAANLRTNLATWAVPTCSLPGLAVVMASNYPAEQFDQQFYGQYLETTYFDTPGFTLRKARAKGNRYLTLRLRRYAPAADAGGDYPKGRYAVSVKTEDLKQRFEITPGDARALLYGASYAILAGILSPDLIAQLLELAGDQVLQPTVTVCAHRYAVENDTDRLTLDTEVTTDTAKALPHGVLEFKSNVPTSAPDAINHVPGLRPIKLSKFLWATSEI